jgi:class 3 adenylate cyclase
LLRQAADGYPALLNDILRLMRRAAARLGGREVGVHGDEFFAVFRRTPDALLSALAIHRGLRDGAWPGDVTVRVRVGLHVGRPTLNEQGYAGLAVHAVARIATAGHGGQILLSEAALRGLGDPLPPDIAVRDLGVHHLRGLPSESLFQIVVPDLPAEFPPLRTQLVGATHGIGS